MPQENRPDPALAETNPDEWKRQAREWRQNIAARQKWVESQLKMGASLSDLGITDQKEHGRAAYNKYMGLYSNYGNVNPGWRYDWVNGVKYNVGTWDQSAHDRPVPIDPSEWREKQIQEQFGTYPGSYIDRMQADQRGWLERAAAEGQVTTDPRYPNYYWDGQNKYFDRFGAVVDPRTGQRIGGAYGEDDWAPGSNASGLQYGFSGSLGGPSGGGGGGGYGSGGYGSGGSGGFGSLSSNGLLFGSPALEGLAANEGAISAELAKQGRLDTLGKLFEYTRAANQYNQALPQQKYLRDFYGSILGVKFNPGDSTGINNYFNQGINQTGYQGTVPGTGQYAPYGFPTAQPLGNGYFRDPNGQIYYDPNANAQVSGGGRVGGSIPGGTPGPTPATPPSPIGNQMPPVQGGGGVGPNTGGAGGASGGGRNGGAGGAIPSPVSLSGLGGPSLPSYLGPPAQGGPGENEWDRPKRLPPQPIPGENEYDRPKRLPPVGAGPTSDPGYLGPPTQGGKGDTGLIGPPLPETKGTKDGGDGVPINQGHGGGWIHPPNPRAWGGPGSWDIRPVNTTGTYYGGQPPAVWGQPAGDTGQVPPVTPPDQMSPTLSSLMRPHTKPNNGNLPKNPGDNDFPPRETSFMTPAMNGRSEGWAGQGGNFMTPAGQGGDPRAVGHPGVSTGDPTAGTNPGAAPRPTDQIAPPGPLGGPMLPNQTTGGGVGQEGGSGGGNDQGGVGENEPVPPALWYAYVPWVHQHPGGTFSDFLADPANEQAVVGWSTPGQTTWNVGNGGQGQWYRPISPDLPNAPNFDQGSYELTGDSYNPMDRSTWGFLAKGAGQIAGDADKAAEQIRQTLPPGGARDKALAQLAQGKFAGVAGLRQDLTNSALSGISGLTETGLGYSPGSLTGGASTLGNIFSNKYSTDVGAQTSANNLAESQRQFNLGLQNQQRQQRNSLFGALGKGLGNLLSNKIGLGNLFG